MLGMDELFFGSVTRKMRAVFRWKFASCESDRCIALLFSL